MHAARCIEGAREYAHVKVTGYAGDWTAEQIAAGDAGLPNHEADSYGNLMLIVGASALWSRLQNTSITAFDATNARIAVGSNQAAVSNTQTGLQTELARVGMDSSFPLFTFGNGATINSQIQFQATFADGVGNGLWGEWGVCNAPSGGQFIQRKVESGAGLGTKATGNTWQLLVTLQLA